MRLSRGTLPVGSSHSLVCVLVTAASATSWCFCVQFTQANASPNGINAASYKAGALGSTHGTNKVLHQELTTFSSALIKGVVGGGCGDLNKNAPPPTPQYYMFTDLNSW